MFDKSYNFKIRDFSIFDDIHISVLCIPCENLISLLHNYYTWYYLKKVLIKYLNSLTYSLHLQLLMPQ